MRLYARKGSPRLYADLIHPTTGARIRFSTGEIERRAAQKAALSHLQALQRESEQARDGKRPVTLQAALDAYVGTLEGKASHAMHESMARKVTGTHPRFPKAASLPGDRWLHELTPADLEQLALGRRREGLGAQTIAHELKTIRAAARYAAGLGYRTPELMTGGQVKNPWRVPKVDRKTRYLSLDEFDRVFAFMDPERPVEAADGRAAYVRMGQARQDRQDAQDLLVALAMTGGRWNEVAGLRWDQLELDRGIARLWGEKTDEERLVPIPGPADAMLRRRLASREPGQELVFPGRGGERRNPSSCKPILRAMDACGLNSPELVARHGRATVHSLRHTFASTLLQHGADLSEVQEALGHKTLDMTRRYAHLARHASARRLGAILTQVASRDVEAKESAPGGTSQPAPG